MLQHVIVIKQGLNMYARNQRQLRDKRAYNRVRNGSNCVMTVPKLSKP